MVAKKRSPYFRRKKKSKSEGIFHEVHIYHKFHSVCPLVKIRTPHPLFRKRVCPPLELKGGTLACGWGGGGGGGGPNSSVVEPEPEP